MEGAEQLSRLSDLLSEGGLAPDCFRSTRTLAVRVSCQDVDFATEEAVAARLVDLVKRTVNFWELELVAKDSVVEADLNEGLRPGLVEGLSGLSQLRHFTLATEEGWYLTRFARQNTSTCQICI